MKKLLFISLLGTSFTMAFSAQGGFQSAIPDDPDTTIIYDIHEAQTDSMEGNIDADSADIDSVGADYVDDDAMMVDYYGDSITTINGTTYYIGYDDEDETGKDSATAYILAMNGHDTVAKCDIYGTFSHCEATSDGNLLLTYGAEETKIATNPMPARVKMLEPALPDNYRHLSFKQQLQLADSNVESLNMQADIYLPEGYEAAANAILLKGMEGIWADCGKIKPADDTEGLLNEAWNAYKKEYRSLFKNEDEMEHYSFNFNLRPTWQDKAKGLMTLRLYSDGYFGGAHGMYFMAYTTVSKQTQQAQGFQDIFKPEATQAVIALLDKKVDAWKAKYGFSDMGTKGSALDSEPSKGDFRTTTGNVEQIGGKFYPRPALTQRGVVFTYFPYEIGPYASGAAHIVLTYDELSGMLK